MPIEDIMRELVGVQAMERRLSEWAKKIEAEWRRLSDGERVTLIGLCCPHCGTLKLPCRPCKYSENDE
jgi:uncharacterized OB-fold protein